MEHSDPTTMPAPVAGAARPMVRPASPVGGERDHAPNAEVGSIPDRILGVIDAAGLAVAVIDHDGSLVCANAAAELVFGLDARHGGDLGPAVRTVLDQVPQQLVSGLDGGTWSGELSLATSPGRPTTHAVTVMVDPGDAPRRRSIAIVAADITEQRERAISLGHRADHDDATELLNRPAAIERLATRLDEIDPGETTAVAMIDIDRLGDVNHALGHDVGDRLVSSIARRLCTAVRPGDTLARVGGDQFAVVCEGLADDDAATEFGERIRSALSGRLTIGKLELDVSVSVGLTVAGESAFDDGRPARQRALELISQAHTAVRAAKHRGRARSVRFTDELASRARERTELAAALSRALREGQLDLEYQPIFSAVSERTEGAEALLRWDHPTRGRLEAHEFITVAEQTGTIVPIGDWVLREACAATRRWIDAGAVRERFAVHVNVTRLQLGSSSFVNRVVDLLREHRLRPRQLVLEVRESSLVDHDAVEVVRSVRSLRRVGVRVAIDNFGTGSDAISLMTEIGADVLKLDGSLALPSGASETDTRVVRALVLLAHALEMEVVAERVTGIEQLRRLRAAGCDMVQGNLLGAPGRADDLVAQMER
jgi:diguanylate cyclase (GGDEF)-like protein